MALFLTFHKMIIRFSSFGTTCNKTNCQEESQRHSTFGHNHPIFHLPAYSLHVDFLFRNFFKVATMPSSSQIYENPGYFFFPLTSGDWSLKTSKITSFSNFLFLISLFDKKSSPGKKRCSMSYILLQLQSNVLQGI